MRKKLMKKLGIILIAISMFSLLGCSEVNQKQADQAVSLLEEKYNQKFVATHIGERYGTATNDTITTIVHPEGKENLIFKTKVTKDGELIGDGYIPKLISDQFNNILKKELESIGIESETFTLAMKTNSSGETDTSITIEEYVKKYQPGFFSAQAIVKGTGNITGEQFEQALTRAYEAGAETIYQVQARVIPEAEYEKAREEFIKLTDVSSSWFLDYNVVEKIDAVADPNGYNFRYSGGHSAIGDHDS
ncbi:hypothetical protein [Oceanobacillus sp. Castelsardo]|uniref:hypothetical protein n=1 Tax=Oceanobacillus sp. Castelsardo TaxID=1851204 RepID=UPI0012E9127B|nr:hypothetical protein [Oceanobacillus sp. Castelsardo]